MDVKVSRKTPRYQPDGNVEVLMDNIFDLYPVFSPDDENLITNVEVLDDAEEELLDQAMWAVVKQKGDDPLDLTDGNPHEECILGEVSVVAFETQIVSSVMAVGPGVVVDFSSYILDGKNYLTVLVKLSRLS